MEIEPESFEICFAETHSSGAEKPMHHQETEPAGVTRRRSTAYSITVRRVVKFTAHFSSVEPQFTAMRKRHRIHQSSTQWLPEGVRRYAERLD